MGKNDSDTGKFRFIFLVVVGIIILATAFYHNVTGRMNGGPLAETVPVSMLLDTESVTSQVDKAGLPSGPVSEIEKVLIVQDGEGLIAVARRAGLKLGLKDAMKIAKEASREVIWYRPELNKVAVIYAPSLTSGEPVVIYKDGRIRIMTRKEVEKTGL